VCPRFSAAFAFEADDCWRLVKPLTFMDRILSLQVYLVSSSSAAPWPGALPLQLRGPNYGDGDTNTFSKMMFELFTEYLTGWQICQLPLSSEGWKLFSFRAPLTRGSAPGPRWGLCPQTPNTTLHCKPPGLATDYWYGQQSWSVPRLLVSYYTHHTLVWQNTKFAVFAARCYA